MAAHNELGKQGEDLALFYLQSIGYQIVGRNWRCGRHEVDIIAIDDDEYVFVEVKTRSTDLQEPEQAVDAKKIHSIAIAAYGYINYNKIRNRYRFDVVTILAMHDNEPVITHFKEAFNPAAYHVPNRYEGRGKRRGRN